MPRQPATPTPTSTPATKTEPTYRLQFDDPGMYSKSVTNVTAENLRSILDTERNYSSIFVTDETTDKTVQWFKRDERTDWTWKPLMAHGTQF